MAAKRITMLQIRLLLKKKKAGNSIREISKTIPMGRNTVRRYLEKFNKSGLTIEEISLLADEELYALISETEQSVEERNKARLHELKERIPQYLEELKKVGVTRLLLWQEYKSEVSNGLSYTQFCEYIKRHIARNNLSAMFEHKPGDVMQIDFAGKKFSYIDRKTGELVDCSILVCVLPFSNIMYVEALRSQNQAHFVSGICNALEFIGGVPKSILMDNLKSGVIKANRYEPKLTELIEQLSSHYNTTFMATRVRKPKDKSHVEGGVRLTYQRIFAPLRNQIFHSIEQINEAFLNQLNIHHKKLFSGKDYSRFDLFETEKKYLLSLPNEAFIVNHSTNGKVQKNYHVILGEDKHQYSVPYQLVGKRLKLIYNQKNVEIYDGIKRVAIHERDFGKYGYTTKTEHMPANHLHYYEQKGWDSTYFLNLAKRIGPHTYYSIERILASRHFIQQTFKSCLGVFSLGKKLGYQRLEAACARANTGSRVNYQLIKNILENNLDKIKDQDELNNHKTPQHNNIRGKNNYK